MRAHFQSFTKIYKFLQVKFSSLYKFIWSLNVMTTLAGYFFLINRCYQRMPWLISIKKHRWVSNPIRTTWFQASTKCSHESFHEHKKSVTVSVHRILFALAWHQRHSLLTVDLVFSSIDMIFIIFFTTIWCEWCATCRTVKFLRTISGPCKLRHEGFPWLRINHGITRKILGLWCFTNFMT